MKDLFVSYRRSDSSDVTGRIYDHLKANFGEDRLFKDVDSIPLGKDFRRAISEAVGQCKVLIAVIGDQWLEAAIETGTRRLDDPNDFVHIEIMSALSRGIPVIPVLVEDAPMPKESELPPALGELAFRNGTRVRPDPDFRPDIERLCSQIESYIVDGPKPTPSAFPPWMQRRAVLAALVLPVLAMAAFLLWGRFKPSGRTIVGKWEHSALDQGRWARHRILEVSESGRTLDMKNLDDFVKTRDYKILSIDQVRFDGARWSFQVLFGDGVRGYFSFDRVSDDLFTGTLTTNNREAPSQHRLSRFDAAQAEKEKLEWAKNWHTITEPRPWMSSSGPPEEGGGSFTSRGKFLDMLTALDLSSEPELEQLRAKLKDLVQTAPAYPAGGPSNAMRVTLEISQVEDQLRRGVRNRAIDSGVDVQDNR
jgi:hypothetical protein